MEVSKVCARRAANGNMVCLVGPPSTLQEATSVAPFQLA
jgi:hypothetical protein